MFTSKYWSSKRSYIILAPSKYIIGVGSENLCLSDNNNLCTYFSSVNRNKVLCTCCLCFNFIAELLHFGQTTDEWTHTLNAVDERFPKKFPQFKCFKTQNKMTYHWSPSPHPHRYYQIALFINASNW